MIYIVAPRGRLASHFITTLESHNKEFNLIQTMDGFSLDGISSKDTVINFAAKGVRIEDRAFQPQSFKQVNLDLPQYLSEMCLETGAHFIHFTTELEIESMPDDPYVTTKFESSQKVLQLAPFGLKVACISLPSIVGFMNRPSHIEKLILNSISNREVSIRDVHIHRGILHKFDFSHIIYQVLMKGWHSEEIITIATLTQLTPEIFIEIMNSFFIWKKGDIFDYEWPRHKAVDFAESTLTLEPIDSATVMNLLLNDAQRLRTP